MEAMDGRHLREMLAAGLTLLERHQDTIDLLNVFPVPDGDTGRNMVITLGKALERAGEEGSADAGQVAQAMASAALRAAMGNSGVILSHFLRGLAVALEGKSRFGPEDLALGLRLAKEFAYRGVDRPVEGTILTVIARAAAASEDHDGRLDWLLRAVAEEARKAMEDTPRLLPILREAGVVDAGGAGLYVILEGARRWAAGEDLDRAAAVPVADDALGAVSRAFLESAAQEAYGFCTQFVIEGRGLDPDRVRRDVISMGRSVVVAGDHEFVSVHLHTEAPDDVLAYARSLGRVDRVKVQDMDTQHRQFAQTHRSAQEELPVALVAVAAGHGLQEVFRSIGVSRVVQGGDTMNPSVQELLEAIEEAPSRRVVVLPNNRNITPAAKEAARLSSKEVHVLETASVPQGVAAAIAFIPGREVEEALAEMEAAASAVRTGLVTTAVRSAVVGGQRVERGQVMGLLDGRLAAVGREVGETLVALLRQAQVGQEAIVTLYWGAPLSAEEAHRHLEAVEAAFPELEVELVEGGQPHYHYIVAIE